MSINDSLFKEILSKSGAPAAIDYLVQHENLSIEKAHEYLYSVEHPGEALPPLLSSETPNKYFCEKDKLLFVGTNCPECGCDPEKGECELPMNTDEGVVIMHDDSTNSAGTYLTEKKFSIRDVFSRINPFKK